MPDTLYYKSLIDSHMGTFNAFLGETSMVSTNETWQYDNYDLYVGEFDMDVKCKFREDVFPEDCKKHLRWVYSS